MKPHLLQPDGTLYQGDCLPAMNALPENSIDTIITDPPYGLGFMGKAWDHGVPGVPFWQAALRVAKPGAFLLAFGGTRTFHRLTCAIEDAGWEVRDCMMFLYGSGFPKSHNFGCKCDKHTGRPLPYDHAESKAEHVLRPMCGADVSSPVNADDQRREVLFAGVPEQGAPAYGEACAVPENAGGGESCVEGRRYPSVAQGELSAGAVCPVPDGVPVDGEDGRLRDGAPANSGADPEPSAPARGVRSSPQPSAARQPARKPRPVRKQSGPQTVRGARDAAADVGRCPDCGGVIGWGSYGTALKPAFEPIIVAMKPLDGTFAGNAQRHGVAGLNIDGGRIGSERPAMAKVSNGKPREFLRSEGRAAVGMQDGGRWPANVLLDTEAAAMLDAQVLGNGLGRPDYVRSERDFKGWEKSGELKPATAQQYLDETPGASRFFYTAKASRSDRGHGNDHPTVKPTDLLKYLCKLTATPTGGVVLDPFAGSGTTLVAAREYGRPWIGIELEEAHCRIIVERLRQGHLFGASA